MSKKSPIDYKVKVTIYGLPEKGIKKQIVSYLKKVISGIEKEKDIKVWNKRVIFKLMK